LNRVVHWCPDQPGHDPPVYASHVAGMAGMYHYTQLYWLRWGLINFLPRLASKCNLLASAKFSFS
jgi:hypothetical protein